ncbi:MAG: helix-turn-helix domain-containing protein [Saprospiraceae bacterium]
MERLNAVILSREHYDAIIEKLDFINKDLRKKSSVKRFFLDNKSFNDLMGVSPGTAKLWREEGKIGYSKIGGKIYYRMSDIEKFFTDHYHLHSAISERNIQSA